MTRPTDFIVHIAVLLERLGVPYHVGGSTASSAYGLYRSSADVDVVIDPSPDQLDALASALEPEFYVSRSAIAEAASVRGTFNAIHVATSFKIDFFLKGPAPFDAEELRRSVRMPLGDPGGHEILLKSPEDTVLRKLDWFRRGGEVSENQWQDVLSILRATQGRLDDVHLEHWAEELGIAGLLARARRESAL